MKYSIAACLAALWLLAGGAHGETYTERMNTPFPIPATYQLVNDYEEVLRIVDRVALEKRLQALERHNGTQIVFLSVPNTGEEGPVAYAQAVFKKWDIGNNGQGNGMLLLVGGSRAVIVTGPGIAGAVPDVLAARIHRDVLMPEVKRGDLSSGVEHALDALIKASYRETSYAVVTRDHAELIPDTLYATDKACIAGLCALAAAYAGWLLWQRRASAGRT